jgi:hypothetical protein
MPRRAGRTRRPRAPPSIASAHSPLITAASIDAAYDIARTMPTVTPPDLPGQDVLDEVVAATAA